MVNDTEHGWRRAAGGRWIAGVSGAVGRRLGLPVASIRAAFVGFAAGGCLLALSVAVFDGALFGGLADGVRIPLIAFGLTAAFLYPLLALLLPDEFEPARWNFASAAGAVGLLMLLGQVLGNLLTPYWDTAKAAWIERGNSGWFTWFGDYQREVGFGAKDVVFALFLLSSVVFVWLQRTAIRRFFRSMNVGVSLVTLSTLAVGVGVLVPQIDGFEDPDQRVDFEKEYADYVVFKDKGYQKLPLELQDRNEQYQAFRWAEGYFLYHMLHLYGIGMPSADLSPQMVDGLERFGTKYGREEAENRRKQMAAAFTGREKLQEIGAFIHRNEDAFWRAFEISTLLHLNRTYKAHWFTTLLTLLGVAIFLNTFKGRPKQWFSVQKFGFFTVHMGMMVLLLGGATSKLFTDRGILHLFLGEPGSNTYWRHYRNDELARMPFTVRLDEFARKDWMALEVHFLKEDFASRPPRYTLWEGREIELDHVPQDADATEVRLEETTRPRIALRVKELYDRVSIGATQVIESQNENFPPVAGIEVDLPREGHSADDGHDHAVRGYLQPMSEAQQRFRDEVFRDVAGGFRLAASYGDDPERLFPPLSNGSPGQVLGQLHVSVAGEADGAQVAYPVRLGEEFEVTGGFRLRVYDATTDLRMETTNGYSSTHPLPLEEQPYQLCATYVEITPPEGGPSERRVVIEGIDSAQRGDQGNFQYADVFLNLTWDNWTSPGPPRFLMHWSKSSAPVLLGQDGSRHTIELGQRLELPGPTPVVAADFFHHGEFENSLEFHENEIVDGWDSDFYARTPRGLVVDVVHEPGTPEERVETIRMATTQQDQLNLWFSPDGRFALYFTENSEMLPFEWRSVLSILEEDNSGKLYEVPLGSEAEREIRVNDYFFYKGYRFFQTNAIPEEPKYSGIGVVYDPGIPIVLFGMYTVIAGTVIAFLIRPVVLARREAKKGAAA